MKYYLPMRYYEIEDMFACYYYDEDFISDDSEKKIAADFAYKNRGAIDYVSKIIRQGEELLKLKVFPWDEIGEASNRFFETPEEAKVWLQLVVEQIKKTIMDCY